MMDFIEEEEVFVSGRSFTQDELDEIIEIINMFSNLSYTELVCTICENISWKTPTGSLKVSSCERLLDKLEEEGVIDLPKKRPQAPRPKKKVTLTSKTDPDNNIGGTVRDVYPIRLEPVGERSKADLWDEYVQRYHVLGYKQQFGARQKYFINSSAGILGCMLFSAAAWALSERDKWIGWAEKDKSKYLNGIVNNSRFLIFPWVKVKNLASKVLSIAANQIREDWQDRYGYAPVLLETFVDEKLYAGTSYKAANWIYLGKTTGRGRMDRYKEYLSSPKLIYVYPLVKNFRSYLQGQQKDWEVGRYG